jgi:chromosome segregation ATPase
MRETERLEATIDALQRKLRRTTEELDESNQQIELLTDLCVEHNINVPTTEPVDQPGILYSAAFCV